jgi:alanyl-tRNA synthetase
MSTQRLYYTDSHARTFTAQAQASEFDGRPAVLLDRTLFYPTGGGQPTDTGSLNGIPVLDVVAREDGEVLHVLEQPIASGPVSGEIHWQRRFDHMQQHTGQHILTQAFVQTSSAHTVGFHLSPTSLTIDLDHASLSAAELDRAEALANQVVWENRPVRARLIDPEQTEGVRIRRLPGQIHTDGLRVIDIADFDQTACGGTHVAATGEIGMIKILRAEKRGDRLRVEFRCGGRALTDYSEKNAIASRLTAALTVGLAEVPDAIDRLRESLRSAQREAETLQRRVLEAEAQALATTVPVRDGVQRIVLAAAGRPAADLRTLAGALVGRPGRVALLGTVNGDRADVLFARSADQPHDMAAFLRETLAALGGRGGGQPSLAQGSAPASVEALQAALDALAARL